ncbi:MAG: hypothetical protein U0235_27775 [Polyangiaceae bacterium]
MQESGAFVRGMAAVAAAAIAVGVACGSSDDSQGSTGGAVDGGGTDGPALATGDGGAASEGGGSTSCRAVGTGCESEKDCCSGFCPGHVCADPNVDISATCTNVTPCGGDPSGTWKLVSGCGAPKTACGKDGRGAITMSEPLVITAAGPSGSVSIAHDLHACGWVTQGSNSVNAPGLQNDGGFGGGWPYCVDGSTLWLFPTHSPNPESYLTAIKLTR